MSEKVKAYTFAAKRIDVLVILIGALLSYLAIRHSHEYQSIIAPVEAAQTSSLFHNDRLKQNILPDYPIDPSNQVAIASGILLPESKDPGQKLAFPEQLQIECTRNSLYPEHKQGECSVISESLGVMTNVVEINHPDEDRYEITRWDSHGLSASYTDNYKSKCQLHILTMAFQAGIVSVSDIPTHKQGCAAFLETHSYRLARGNYYVDTTPNNDGDKPYPKQKK